MGLPTNRPRRYSAITQNLPAGFAYSGPSSLFGRLFFQFSQLDRDAYCVALQPSTKPQQPLDMTDANQEYLDLIRNNPGVYSKH
eukprot:4270582-Alexandrium_andersonii.AAC.1